MDSGPRPARLTLLSSEFSMQTDVFMHLYLAGNLHSHPVTGLWLWLWIAVDVVLCLSWFGLGLTVCGAAAGQ